MRMRKFSLLLTCTHTDSIHLSRSKICMHNLIKWEQWAVRGTREQIIPTCLLLILILILITVKQWKKPNSFCLNGLQLRYFFSSLAVGIFVKISHLVLIRPHHSLFDLIIVCTYYRTDNVFSFIFWTLNTYRVYWAYTVGIRSALLVWTSSGAWSQTCST